MPSEPDQERPVAAQERALAARERAIAARLLKAVVVDRQTSDQALARDPVGPLSRDMFYGAMRHYFSLAAAVDAALTKPLRDKDLDVRCLLIVGAYQLRHMRIPDHAAINETVAACKVLKKTSVTGLVNAVLRNLQRKSSQTERSFESAEAMAETDFPGWLNELIRRDYPSEANALIAANLERAPLTLRINTRRCEVAHYQALLDEQGIGYTAAFKDEYLVLDQPTVAEALPGFADGLVAIQDAGAGFVVDLLLSKEGATADANTGTEASTEAGTTTRRRVLDACAAPGGKLFHLLESQPDVEALAIEKSATRMVQLEAEARRLGHTPNVVVADATNLDWWDRCDFDAILIDAPCSGSGTLRRHPDIKILRSASDLARYAALQGELLTNLWRTLRPGGSLLYCTCSLFAEENDAVVATFVEATNNARVEHFELPTGIPRQLGWQLLPTENKTDGFYFSLITKDQTRLPT